MNWTLYLLRCRGGRLYTGITNDLERRLAAHETGKGSRFVRAFSPFELVGTIPCADATEARKLEWKIKRMRREEKLDLLEGANKQLSEKGK